MKVILLADVKKVGQRGAVVEVADGYAQNVLLRQGLALPGTAENLKRHAKVKDKEADARAFNDTLLHKSIEALDGKTLEMHVRANDSGTLFQTIHTADVGAAIEKHFKLSLPATALVVGDIKKLGTYPVTVSGGGKKGSLTLAVLGE